MFRVSFVIFVSFFYFRWKNLLKKKILLLPFHVFLESYSLRRGGVEKEREKERMWGSIFFNILQDNYKFLYARRERFFTRVFTRRNTSFDFWKISSTSLPFPHPFINSNIVFYASPSSLCASWEEYGRLALFFSSRGDPYTTRFNFVLLLLLLLWFFQPLIWLIRGVPLPLRSRPFSGLFWADLCWIF